MRVMKDLETAAKEHCSKQGKEPSELDRLVLDSKCKSVNVKVSQPSCPCWLTACPPLAMHLEPLQQQLGCFPRGQVHWPACHPPPPRGAVWLAGC